jgi:hypothetical protein
MRRADSDARVTRQRGDDLLQRQIVVRRGSGIGSTRMISTAGNARVPCHVVVLERLDFPARLADYHGPIDAALNFGLRLAAHKSVFEAFLIRQFDVIRCKDGSWNGMYCSQYSASFRDYEGAYGRRVLDATAVTGDPIYHTDDGRRELRSVLCPRICRCPNNCASRC